MNVHGNQFYRNSDGCRFIAPLKEKKKRARRNFQKKLHRNVYFIILRSTAEQGIKIFKTR